MISLLLPLHIPFLCMQTEMDTFNGDGETVLSLALMHSRMSDRKLSFSGIRAL